MDKTSLVDIALDDRGLVTGSTWRKICHFSKCGNAKSLYQRYAENSIFAQHSSHSLHPCDGTFHVQFTVYSITRCFNSIIVEIHMFL